MEPGPGLVERDSDVMSDAPVRPRFGRSAGGATIRRGQGAGAVAAQLHRFVSEHPGADVVVEWRIE